MSEKTETVIRVLPDIEKRVVDLSEKLEQLATQYSPDVWEATKAAVMLDGLENIVFGAFLVIVAVVCGFVGWRSYRWGSREENLYRDGSMKTPADVGVTFGCLFGSLAGMIGFMNLLSVTSWAALFYPEVILAKEVLGL